MKMGHILNKTLFSAAILAIAAAGTAYAKPTPQQAKRALLRSSAGVYTGTLGGSYVIDTTSVGGSPTQYPFLSNPTRVKLPRGKGRGNTDIEIAGITLRYNFKVTKSKVRGKRVEFSGRGDLVDAASSLEMKGTIKGSSKKAGGKMNLSALAKLEGTQGPAVVTVDARIKAKK